MNKQVIDWGANIWFSEYHLANITEEFKGWWLDYYGKPSEYSQTEDEQDEYWVRCAFAWIGWSNGKV